MEPLDIPEIKEAVELLKLSESKLPSKISIDNFKNAIEILDIYVEDEPNTLFINSTLSH